MRLSIIILFLLFSFAESHAQMPNPESANGNANEVNENSLHHVANTRPPDAFVSLRTQPSATAGQRIRTMPNGTKLMVLEKRPDNWWKVRVVPSGEEGWALSRSQDRAFIECCVDEKPLVVSKETTSKDKRPAGVESFSGIISRYEKLRNGTVKDYKRSIDITFDRQKAAGTVTMYEVDGRFVATASLSGKMQDSKTFIGTTNYGATCNTCGRDDVKLVFDDSGKRVNWSHKDTSVATLHPTIYEMGGNGWLSFSSSEAKVKSVSVGHVKPLEDTQPSKVTPREETKIACGGTTPSGFQFGQKALSRADALNKIAGKSMVTQQISLATMVGTVIVLDPNADYGWRNWEPDTSFINNAVSESEQDFVNRMSHPSFRSASNNFTNFRRLRALWRTGMVKRFEARRQNNYLYWIAVLKEEYQQYCAPAANGRTYQEGDEICLAEVAERCVGQVTGITGGDTVKQVEFVVNQEPTKFGRQVYPLFKLFNESLDKVESRVENRSVNFVLYDDGWRLMPNR